MLPLGWEVIGNMCLNGIHTTYDVNAYLTHIAPDRQASILQPCFYNHDNHESFGCRIDNFGVFKRKDNTNTSAIL